MAVLRSPWWPGVAAPQQKPSTMRCGAASKNVVMCFFFPRCFLGRELLDEEKTVFFPTGCDFLGYFWMFFLF